MPHHGGLEEGQKVHIQRAVFVGEGDGHRRTGEHRADVHPAVLQQGRAEGDAVGGVVVAADGKHRQLPLSQLGEEPVQQAHGFGRGNGLIVEVARQQHTVHGLAVQQGEDLFQNVPLVVQHGELAHPLAQMQVGKMQKTQTETPPFQSFLYYTAGRGWGQGNQKRETLSVNASHCRLSRRAGFYASGDKAQKPLLKMLLTVTAPTVKKWIGNNRSCFRSTNNKSLFR